MVGFAGASAGRAPSQGSAAAVRWKPGRLAARLTSRHFGCRSDACSSGKRGKRASTKCATRPDAQVLAGGYRCGKSVGRDEGDVDARVAEHKRDIAGAGVAQPREDAEALVLLEKTRHVGCEHGFRSGRGTCDQAEPGVFSLGLGRRRTKADQSETENE
jgi:hypothetical protein